jgi:NADH-quinone oxidoreductase subunit M
MTPFYTSSDPLVWLLTMMVIVPFFMGFLFLLSPQGFSRRYADALGLLVVLFCLCGAVILWLNFRPIMAGYAFLSTMPLGLQAIGARLQLGLNAISMPMFTLTALIGCAAGFYAYGQAPEHKGFYWAFLLLILAGLLGAFASVDIFYAFLFHETALLPIFLALMMFGGENRREVLTESGIFMLAGSLPTLVGITNYALQAGPLSFSLIDIRCHLANHAISPSLQMEVWAPLFWGCAILSGLWPFHGWVSRLLTQVPVPVSMLVGGSLKFFGVYFLLQAFLGSSFWGVDSLQTVTGVLCAISIVWVGILAFRQSNFRAMVALAAVMHMGGLFLALSSYTAEALSGTVILMLASGLTTALLLMLSGAVGRRLGHLEMPQMGGIRQSAPVLSTFLMFGVLSLMALPCFLNFWGELGVIVGAFRGVPLWAPFLLAGLFITAAFGLRALSSMLMGKKVEMSDLTQMEIFSSWILVLPLVLLGVLPFIISTPISLAMKTIIPAQL